MKTYKFLAKGALGPLSGFAWPAPRGEARGAWVEAGVPLAVCARGVHVCRPADLAHWLHEELWEMETHGERLEALDCLVVERARLVRRVDAWSEGGAARFAAACTDHALALAAEAAAAGASSDPTVRGFLHDAALAAQSSYLAVAAFCAASAVSCLHAAGPTSAPERVDAFRRERRWQADWIARELLGIRS